MTWGEFLTSNGDGYDEFAVYNLKPISPGYLDETYYFEMVV
jgi:hypothetical protein